MDNIKEDINNLKKYYGVNTYKELAKCLNIGAPAIDGWIRNKKIPLKYLMIINRDITLEKEEIKEKELLSKRENFADNVMNREKSINAIKERVNELSNLEILDIIEKIFKVKILY